MDRKGVDGIKLFVKKCTDTFHDTALVLGLTETGLFPEEESKLESFLLDLNLRADFSQPTKVHQISFFKQEKTSTQQERPGEVG